MILLKWVSPPARHSGPHRGVDDVERLEILLVLIPERAVNVFDPPIVRNISTIGLGVEVDDHVRPVRYNGVKNFDKIEESVVLK